MCHQRLASTLNCYHVPSEAKHFRHFTLWLEKWLSVEGLVSVHETLVPTLAWITRNGDA